MAASQYIALGFFWLANIASLLAFLGARSVMENDMVPRAHPGFRQFMRVLPNAILGLVLGLINIIPFSLALSAAKQLLRQDIHILMPLFIFSSFATVIFVVIPIAALLANNGHFSEHLSIRHLFVVSSGLFVLSYAFWFAGSSLVG